MSSYTQCSQCKEYTLTTEVSCAHCHNNLMEDRTMNQNKTDWGLVAGIMIALIVSGLGWMMIFKTAQYLLF